MSLVVSPEEAREMADPKSAAHKRLVDAIQEAAKRTTGNIEITIAQAPSSSSEYSSEYLTTKEVAEMYRVAERTVRHWCATGRIQANRLGEHWRIPGQPLRLHADATRKLRDTVAEINQRFGEPVSDEYE